MRSFAGALLTGAGILAVLCFVGGVAKTVQVWRAPETRCVFDHRPGAEGFCLSSVPVTGLAKVPWEWIGVSIGLLLLAVCLFTLSENLRPET